MKDIGQSFTAHLALWTPFQKSHNHIFAPEENQFDDHSLESSKCIATAVDFF